MRTLFDGPELTREDEGRLGKCLAGVLGIMADGQWRTFAEIQSRLEGMEILASEAGVSARLRDLRKPKFGGFVVEKRRRSAGVWEYRLGDRSESRRAAS